jgi:hypothetical protein
MGASVCNHTFAELLAVAGTGRKKERRKRMVTTDVWRVNVCRHQTYCLPYQTWHTHWLLSRMIHYWTVNPRTTRPIKVLRLENFWLHEPNDKILGTCNINHSSFSTVGTEPDPGSNGEKREWHYTKTRSATFTSPTITFRSSRSIPQSAQHRLSRNGI